MQNSKATNIVYRNCIDSAEICAVCCCTCDLLSFCEWYSVVSDGLCWYNTVLGLKFCVLVCSITKNLKIEYHKLKNINMNSIEFLIKIIAFFGSRMNTTQAWSCVWISMCGQRIVIGCRCDSTTECISWTKYHWKITRRRAIYHTCIIRWRWTWLRFCVA